MKKVFYNIGELVTASGPNRLRQGQEMEDAGIIKNAYLVIEDGKVKELGSGYPQAFPGYKYIDVQGKLITPGLIDSHTHLVHAGSREDELRLKLEGKDYLEILKAGGGILSTVRATRAASYEELYNQSKKSLIRMAEYGVTAIEIKSGYGLDRDTEIKTLEVISKLKENYPLKLKSTFMGAHALPKEYSSKSDYLQFMKEVLSEIKERNLAEFCDIFCEEGVFGIEESRDFLSFAKELGFGIRVHADEMTPLGGAKLAAELKAASADHLLRASDDDLRLLGKEGVACTILPLTSFYLNKPFARTRFMIDANCGLVIATDYNPGSSPSENIQLAMQIAYLKTGLSRDEVIIATTINAAASLGLTESKGSLMVGKDADFVIFDCLNLDYFLYHFGVNHVQDVYLGGQRIVKNQKYQGVKDEVN